MASDEASGDGLPHSIQRMETRGRSWNGMRFTTNKIWYKPDVEVCFHLGNADATRLVMMIEEYGGFGEARVSRRTPCPVDHRLPNAMAYGPAGLDIWGYCDRHVYTRDANMMFDVDTLSEKFEHHISRELLEKPRLRFNDERLWRLGKMLVDLPEGDTSQELLGDAVAVTMFAILYENAEMSSRSGQLANWQLKRVVEYMNVRLPDQVELGELAALVGLSQFHFARAFKATTGKSPYQYQLETRIQEAKLLLATSAATLDIISKAVGFGDAMHFIRAFKKKVGVTPAVWRRANSDERYRLKDHTN